MQSNQHNAQGQRHGPWEEYHDNGILKYRGTYYNGFRNEAWEIYYDNGELHFKGNYINDHVDGYCEWNVLTGKIIKGLFVNRRRIGLFKVYNRNKILQETRFYAR